MLPSILKDVIKGAFALVVIFVMLFGIGLLATLWAPSPTKAQDAEVEPWPQCIDVMCASKNPLPECLDLNTPQNDVYVERIGSNRLAFDSILELEDREYRVDESYDIQCYTEAYIAPFQTGTGAVMLPSGALACNWHFVMCRDLPDRFRNRPTF